MTNPFGITEVDIPGVLGAYQAAQRGRLQQMQMQMQIRQAEQAATRQAGIQQIVAREAARGMGGGQAGQPRAASPGGMAEVAAAFGAPETSWAPPAQPAQPAAQPRQQSRLNPQQLFAELVSVGSEPAEARQIVQALSGMDDQGLEAVRLRYQTIAPLYIAAAQMPYEQRRAYIQSVRGQLNQLGLTDEQIDGFDPTDQNLNAHISLGTPIAAALEQSRPNYREVDGVLLDTNRIGSGQDPAVYTSPFINVGGSLYPRPGAGAGRGGQLPRVSTPQEASRLPPGTQFIDPQGNVRTVPGGPASSAPGGFPATQSR